MSAQRILGIIATLVIVAAVIAGLVLIEGPGKARTDRFDAERINNLNGLAHLIDAHYREHRDMPADLSEIEEEYDFDRLSLDPRTDEPYPYERLSENSYRLCATFENEGPHRISAYRQPVLEWQKDVRTVSPTAADGAGQHCFEFVITSGD